MSRDKRQIQRQGGFQPDAALVATATQTTQTATLSISPLPPAEELERLEALHPGITAILLRLTEDEGDHRRALEKADQLHRHDMERGEAFRSTLGLCLGFAVGIAGFGATVWLGLAGHDWLAGTLGIGDITSLVTVFVIGRTILNRRKETPTKRR